MTDRSRFHECRSCAYARPVAFTHHIRCTNPDPAMTGNPHGIKNGWFDYPLRFDPVWKARDCRHFLPEEMNDAHR